MKLTKRDIQLLGIVTLVLVVVLFGRFLIFPQFEHHAELEDVLMEAQAQHDEVEMKIASRTALEDALAENEKMFENVTEDYYPLMESYEAERMITQTILGAGLTVQDFEISSNPYICAPVPYFASELAAMSASSDAVEGEMGEGTGETSTPTSLDSLTFEPKDGSSSTQSTVYGTTISVTAIGSLDSMKNLIDTIYRDYPAIRVTSYTINSDEAITRENQVVNTTTLNLGLEVYMCNK